MLRTTMIRHIVLQNIKLCNRRAISTSSKLLSKTEKETTNKSNEDLTHFGFETVKREEKAQKGNSSSQIPQFTLLIN